MKEFGCVHVYTGNGKGKTSAAVGQTIRAVGRGASAALIPFLKTTPSGEWEVLQQIGVQVIQLETPHGFYPELNEEQKELLYQQVQEEFAQAERLVGQVDLLFLDEVFGAVSNGLLTAEDLCRLIESAKGKTELLLTGRNAPPSVCAAADYVTECLPLCHPYEKGIPARYGIEF